ncbi:isoaspartyl peptidase/L-asparaginase family protein [Pontibacter rugosus]|uniref:Isoaspartyl peptidase/L-asparaginase family protein n=1 Tax=Pontibacter rugosus TaxID=1745966 RepID=A0ABW3SNZ5_9BACT
MIKYVIAIHGGAVTLDRDSVSKEKEQHYRKGLQEALEAGNAVLREGGSAVEAVTAAVVAMENNPAFNAGKGGNLNVHGENLFDASIMEGKELKIGAVGAVQHVKNPIKLAKAVMEHCKHNFLVVDGAKEFAIIQGLELEKPSYFTTEENLKDWQQSIPENYSTEHDTVGAVALDQNGNMAAATSTGGLKNQLKGRISDSPIIGGGTYANNDVCAVSCTGEGEVIMRGAIAHEVYALVRYAKEDLQAASDKAVRMHEKHLKVILGLFL